MKPITKKEIKSICVKNNAFIDLKKSFAYKMSQFNDGFANAVEVNVIGVLKFKILTCNHGYSDDLNENIVSVPIRNQYRICGFHRAKEFYNILLDNLISHITDYINRHTEDLHYPYISLASVSLNPTDKYSIQFIDLVSWSESKVAIWYVEQECGQSWILLPRDYNRVEQNEYKVID